MADATVTIPETPTEALGQTTLEHDGRVFTGTDTDAEATADAFAETTVGRKVEQAEAKDAKNEGQRQTRGQRRFDRLTKEREDAKRDAEEAKAREAALRAELEALKTKPVAATATDATAIAEPAKAEIAPKGDRPKLEDFLDQEDPIKAFDAALAAYYDQSIDARLSTRLEAERASRQLTKTVADLRERGKSTYADFEAVIAKADVKLPEPILWEIVNDPGGEHIQYAIATNPAVRDEVLKIQTPLQLGRFLARYGTAPTSAAPASPVVTKSQAPRPFQPVSGASRTASPSHEELAEAGDYERYKAKRHSDMGVQIR